MREAYESPFTMKHNGYWPAGFREARCGWPQREAADEESFVTKQELDNLLVALERWGIVLDKTAIFTRP